MHLSANMSRNRRASQKGFALVLTSLMMVFIVSLMGMAVDAGVLFAVRGRLSAAADSAALAAARGVNHGLTAADANAKATDAATRFLKANLPDRYLGIDPAQTSLAATYELSMDGNKPTGLLQVNVHAEVAAPVYFMRFWGVSNVPVSVEGKATRRNLVLIIVLDKSASMGNRMTAPGTLPASSPQQATSCESMVSAASQMADYFSPYDSVGLVSFDSTASKDFPASTTFKSGGLKDSLSRLTCGNYTNTTAALEAAYQEIQRVDQKLAVNAVVLFTDGVPNAVNANFPLRSRPDTRWGPALVPDSHPDASNCRSDSRECQNMPVVCPTGHHLGAIAQGADFALASGLRVGLFKAFASDTPPPSFPTGCPARDSVMASQSLAYIPETDRFGNSTRGPKDNWVFQVNRQCAPADLPVTLGNSHCKNIGGEWSEFTGEWTGQSPGTNFFSAGPYAGKFRTDQANAIGVVSTNTVINQAVRIRSDPAYRIRIDTIYLQGNGPDPVDRDFLPMVSNLRVIPPLPYQPSGTPTSENPLYDPNLPEGRYTQTVNHLDLDRIFAETAASLLRSSP